MPTKSLAAIQIERGGRLEIETIEVADPGPGEVLIRLSASGLCHTDLHLMEDVEQAHVSFRLPALHGHEAIGTVVAAGPGARAHEGDTVMPYVLPECRQCPFCLSGRTNLCFEFKRGLTDQAKSYATFKGEAVGSVGGMGTFSQFLCIQDDQVIVVNPAAPAVPTCCVGCAVTTGVASATIAADVQPGSAVVVFGAGGVGLNVIQGARVCGASIIVAVDISPEKEEIARQFGATHFIDPTKGGLQAQIIELTGIGVDYAFDTVGSMAVFRDALACLHGGGYARLVRIAVDLDPTETCTCRIWQASSSLER